MQRDAVIPTISKASKTAAKQSVTCQGLSQGGGLGRKNISRFSFSNPRVKISDKFLSAIKFRKNFEQNHFKNQFREIPEFQIILKGIPENGVQKFWKNF